LSLFKKGLALAHVPANFPSFFTIILIAIPANANPINKNVIINNSTIIQIY